MASAVNNSISRERMRQLLQQPEYEVVYKRGMEYFKRVKREFRRSDEYYHSCVTEYAVSRCLEIYRGDTKKEYRTEEQLLERFRDQVEKGRYFSVKWVPSTGNQSLDRAIFVMVLVLLLGIVALLCWFIRVR